MSNFDSKAIVNTPNYSRINLGFESIGTLQMGVGTPVLHKTVIPGDDIRLSVDQIMRLAPLATPVFDDVSLHFRAFFVPNRILDPRWKEFITAGIGLYGASDQEIAPLSFTVRSLVSAPDERKGNPLNPQLGSFASGIGGLADWLNFHFAAYNAEEGRPYHTSSAQVLTYSTASSDSYCLLPFLGYQKIYDDWYRNERLQPERLPSIISYLQEQSADERLMDLDFADYGGFDSPNPFAMWRVNYGKDRYTTSLPEPVVGGDVAAVSGLSGVQLERPVVSLSDNYGKVGSSDSSGGSKAFVVQPDGNNLLFANLASAAENTIRNLKAAFKMYDFFMKDTYGGNRYVEFMQNHFDVRVPDATLDRAIYLGDHKVRISFGEVFQTSQGDGSEESGKLGDYAGRGAAYSADGFMFEEKFLEHGQLYVIASVVPRAKYFQGIDRKFFVKDRFDFFFPEFQDIGDDALFENELFNPGVVSTRDNIMSFAPRWSHLKESLDEVHGDFLQNLDTYHFGRRFENQPVLGSTFVTVPTINEPFSVTDRFSENYLANIRWNMSAARPVKLYETF